MLPSIPASNIVNILPSALSAGGRSLSLNTVAACVAAKYEIKEYFDEISVGLDFGLTSKEYEFAVNYFAGFIGSSIKPNSLFISSYVTADRAATLIGRQLRTMQLDDLKQVSGDITLTVDGAQKTGSIDLSTATSFSDAAGLIATALTIDAVFDSQLQAFILSSPTTGASSQISFATGSAANALGLSELQGAQLNNATEKDSAASFMQRTTNSTKNFATVSYIEDPAIDLDVQKDLAKWIGSQSHRYWFVNYGEEPTALISGSTANFGSWLKENGVQDSTPIYGKQKHAAFLCGAIASINFNERNGRTTMDFRNQSGIEPSVTNIADAQALEANGYAYYGAWATANDSFTFFRNSVVSGEFEWADTYANQIWINSQLQLDGITGLQQYKSIPPNSEGKAMYRSMFQDTINSALNFGSIVTGVKLTEQQKSVINREFGYDAATQIELNGWAMYVGDAVNVNGAGRKEFPAKFYYADGGSIQSINMTSTAVL